MKTFDFGKGNLNESKMINNKVNEERVDEFFGTLLICSALGFLATKATMGLFDSIQKSRDERMKAKVEREKQKTELIKAKKEREAAELDKKKDEEKRKEEAEKKEHDKKLKESMKIVMAYENAVNTLKSGPEKDEALKKLGAIKNTMKGTASSSDIDKLREEAAASVPPEAEKIMGRVEDSLHHISDAEVEKELKEQGITIAGINKSVEKNSSKSNDKNDKNNEKEPKTDDELKQELKDKCKDLEGEAIPEQVRDDDGKFSEEKLNSLSGDDLKKTANAAGIKTTKESPKSEETKPEDKKDGEGEEDDPQDADERTDNDDDLEDEKWGQNKEGKLTIDDKNKDPRKIYKQRTYKRGDKTFKTKSYYSKKGVAITKDEFKDKLQAYEKSQQSKKKKNESLGFSITPLSSTAKKQTPVTEAKGATDRVDIIKERLIYIKYVMDTTSNSVEKVQMERMYNALYNLTFNSDGTPRSLKDLYTYLNQVMVENKGKIEGLPTETQIENIDEKVQAFKELHEDKYKAYLTRLDKELLDKAGNKGNDAADDLLHPAGDESDSEIINKIREMSSIYGFTNIIGLEPERKPNPEDDNKKDEIELQQKAKTTGIDTDDNKDVKADDVSDEQIDKIIGAKK